LADPLAVARSHYERQQAIAKLTSQQAQAVWDRLSLNDLTGSWSRHAAELVRTTTVGQVAAAGGAEAYTARALAVLGIDGAAAGTVVPGSFAGIASDGRSLARLLYRPVVTTKLYIAQGTSFVEAFNHGRISMGMIVATQVQDAGRAAAGVAVAARPAVTGYVRYLSPPSCSRCAVLAGRFYRWNDGFQRHPRCDCTHLPSDRDTAKDLTFNSQSYFDGLSKAEQDRTFGVDGARAIRDGADVAQVVNARRGMTEAGTTEGTTRRGLAGQRMLAREGATSFADRDIFRRATETRLMPEQIYAQTTYRGEAIELLRLYRYIA
jgi:hypothetical protein